MAEFYCPHCDRLIPEAQWPIHTASGWTDREKRLWDALNNTVDYIGDGSPDDTYPGVMAEARAAMKDMYLVKPVTP